MTGESRTRVARVRSKTRVAGPLIIAPDEELDITTVDAFRADLTDAFENGGGDVVVDLSDVGFIDSTGLSAILHVESKLRRDGRRLAIVAPRGTAAAMLFTLSGLRSQLAIYDSTRAALRDHP
jgi:anti-sigma B factor antagonist